MKNNIIYQLFKRLFRNHKDQEIILTYFYSCHLGERIILTSFIIIHKCDLFGEKYDKDNDEYYLFKFRRDFVSRMVLIGEQHCSKNMIGEGISYGIFDSKESFVEYVINEARNLNETYDEVRQFVVNTNISYNTIKYLLKFLKENSR